MFPALANLPDRLRLPLAFDPERLARDLAGLPRDGWIDHFLTDRYDGNWDVLPLRGPAEAQHPVMMITVTPGVRAFKDAAALDACPYFRAIIDSFEAPVRSVRLLRLTPGSAILEHSDHEFPAVDGLLRIHIPVVTNDAVDFRLNGSRVVMEAGSAWVLRLCDPHSVDNRGTSDRVHLLIDLEFNDGLGALLERAQGSE